MKMFKQINKKGEKIQYTYVMKNCYWVSDSKYGIKFVKYIVLNCSNKRFIQQG